MVSVSMPSVTSDPDFTVAAFFWIKYVINDARHSHSYYWTLIGSHMRSIELSLPMTLSDRWPGFQGHSTFKGEYYSNRCILCCSLQLQIIYLLNLLYNVPLTRGLVPRRWLSVLFYIRNRFSVQLFSIYCCNILCRNLDQLVYHKSEVQCAPLFRVRGQLGHMPVACFSVPLLYTVDWQVVVVFKANYSLTELNLSRNQLGERKTGSLLQQALRKSALCSLIMLDWLAKNAEQPSRSHFHTILGSKVQILLYRL